MKMRKLMAVGAHADDLEINVGGTLLKYADLGYKIVYLLATNNMSGNWARSREDQSVEYEQPSWDVIMPQRKLEAASAAQQLNAEVIHLDHPQRHYRNREGNLVELTFGSPVPACIKRRQPTILTAHEHPGAVGRLAKIILEHRPEAILTHGMAMVDMEHVGTCLLVTKAYWKAVEAGYSGMLLHWHDITVGPFGEAYCHWDTFVDVTNYWERKVEWMGVHACQIPRPDLMELPPWRAACGCGRAEVFNIVSRGKRPKQGAPFNFEILTHCRR